MHACGWESNQCLDFATAQLSQQNNDEVQRCLRSLRSCSPTHGSPDVPSLPALKAVTHPARGLGGRDWRMTASSTFRLSTTGLARQLRSPHQPLDELSDNNRRDGREGDHGRLLRKVPKHVLTSWKHQNICASGSMPAVSPKSHNRCK